MEKLRRVLLYGKSVILGTLEASLKRYSQMEVCVLSPPFSTVQELKAMAPDVVIFDTGASRPEAAFTLLETCPGLLLIGVDVDKDEMLVLSSHPAQALCITDLVETIQQKSQFLNQSKGEHHEQV